jgi:hypothetical protein
MSAMSEMSKAIREEIEKHSLDATLRGLPLDVLREYIDIVGAYYEDLGTEHARRVSPESRIAEALELLQGIDHEEDSRVARAIAALEREATPFVLDSLGRPRRG